MAFNRVVGLGIERPATQDDLDDILERFRQAGIPRFFVQIAPQAQPTEIGSWLETRGFVHYNNWAKLSRGVEDPPAVETDLRLERIGREHAASFGNILCRAFEWPPDLAPVIAGLVDRPGWIAYMAFAGDRPAATAAMYVRDDWCWIDFASTVPEFRGRRAQPALISRRIRDAAAMGCRHLIVETAEDRPEKPGISCHNVQKMGFEIAYLRPNWLYVF